ncbi:STAS domain-containing protein [Noviherbaspirillum denitrificans]|uniref:Anti-anti-sigma factor n=1 Tax=Noviherbaspirillum denitrificans TaxID=1968433 RepID=A0A254TLI1_9BURK|nr:STAS domain-containing protein [Noviherbaspirillum denitrificans]OWW21473.1 anti-anti-sigma factor [Noviherbaspirillum denitrificans]
MAVPILKQEDFLIASIQDELSDAELVQLRDQLVAKVRQFRSRAVLIDVTVLDIMDSFAARTLRSIAHMTKLLGAETVVAGIQPDVALSMVQLGLTLEGIVVALDLEDGLALLRRRERQKHAANRQ